MKNVKRPAVITTANVITIVITIVIAGAAGLIVWRQSSPTASNTTHGAPGYASPTPIPRIEAGNLSGFDERELAIIEQLRNKYGNRIPGAALQVKVIANLTDLLQKLYPGDWAKRLMRILAAAFPEQIVELRDRFDALQHYTAWLKDVLPQLSFADHAARREAIWNKRIALFGDAANAIWELERREEKLSATVAGLATSTAPFQEKKQTYIRSLQETYGDGITGAGAPHQTQNMTRFLSLASVQNDLRQLPANDRRETLRNFRKDMGLDEAALDRWDGLDAERDSVRSLGSTYMTERSRLESQYHGPELEEQISQLQNRLFGETEARFIRNEEASGHFRFRAPQTIGVN